MRFQSLPARPLRAHLRAADDRPIRVRPGITVPGAAPWAARGGNSRAMGAFTGHESEHAARQHSDVHGCIHDPMEFAEGPLPPESVICAHRTLYHKVLDTRE